MEQVITLFRGTALALLLSACGTGTIGDPASGSGTGPGAGIGNPSGGSGSGIGPGSGSGSSGSNGSGSGGGVTTPPTRPGNVGVRRLNQLEYNRTVADLTGTTLTPANDFPDDLGGEFDTIGSVLSLSPAYVMAYEKAAYALVDDLLAAPVARRQRIVTCSVDTGGDTCAQTILAAFARSAWRRPVTAEEAQSLMLPITTARQLGATPTTGLRHALAAVLMSPFFIYRPEIDPDPASTEPRRLNAHELATRLSYALWSTMPDATLSGLADAGQLSTDAEVGAQIDRMLADPRADALLDSFAAQWLSFRGLDGHEVEPTAFPQYTPAIARSMQLETRRFLQEFLRSDLPVAQLLSARFTFVDATLATHYGLARQANGAAATALVRVDTSNAPRQGVLTLGSFLLATSLASRSSPVKRGEFVFSHLLCGEIQPPPPDVPPLPEDNTAGLTLRQRMEQHRQNPMCSGCHSIMDPIGFGLENYDAVGRYRTQDGSGAIDASGALPDGTMFNGALQLGDVLSRDERLPRCFTQKFTTFAVGRFLDQPDDARWIDYISATAAAGATTKSLPSIIRTVLLSEIFRSRQPVVPM